MLPVLGEPTWAAKGLSKGSEGESAETDGKVKAAARSDPSGRVGADTLAGPAEKTKQGRWMSGNAEENPQSRGKKGEQRYVPVTQRNIDYYLNS